MIKIVKFVKRTVELFLKIFRKAIKYILPYGIVRLFVLLKNSFVNHSGFGKYKNKGIIEKNIILKDQGKGKRAFLLATGPSLKLENLKLLAGEDCFSVSNFFLHEDINIINPKFHFFAPYHKPLDLNNYVEWLKLADEKLPHETKIFLGHATYDLVNEYHLFPNREIFYLYLSDDIKTKKIDLTKPVLAPQTSPLMIIPVLIYMGYKEIYLLGCDHTTLRDYKKTVTNFYNPNEDIRKNATDINCWRGIIQNHKFSLNVFLQYQWYKDILEKFYSINIYNLSKDSWLDLFPFLNLDKIIKK